MDAMAAPTAASCSASVQPGLSWKHSGAASRLKPRATSSRRPRACQRASPWERAGRRLAPTVTGCSTNVRRSSSTMGRRRLHGGRAGACSGAGSSAVQNATCHSWVARAIMAALAAGTLCRPASPPPGTLSAAAGSRPRQGARPASAGRGRRAEDEAGAAASRARWRPAASRRWRQGLPGRPACMGTGNGLGQRLLVGRRRCGRRPLGLGRRWLRRRRRRAALARLGPEPLPATGCCSGGDAGGGAPAGAGGGGGTCAADRRPRGAGPGRRAWLVEAATKKPSKGAPSACFFLVSWSCHVGSFSASVDRQASPSLVPTDEMQQHSLVHTAHCACILRCGPAPRCAGHRSGQAVTAGQPGVVGNASSTPIQCADGFRCFLFLWL